MTGCERPLPLRRLTHHHCRRTPNDTRLRKRAAGPGKDAAPATAHLARGRRPRRPLAARPRHPSSPRAL
eukprot:5382593-Lingulodinium_polyedra.AAC.1